MPHLASSTPKFKTKYNSYYSNSYHIRAFKELVSTYQNLYADTTFMNAVI
jgi:hypothetical protein